MPQLLRDTWEHAGSPLGHNLPPWVRITAVIPLGARLTTPGDQLTIAFTAGPVPLSGLKVLTMGFITPSSIFPIELPRDVSGLTLEPGFVTVEPGRTGGQFTVIRGSEPLESGTYGVALYAEPYDFGSGMEGIASFEVGDG